MKKKKIGYGWVHLVESIEEVEKIHSYISKCLDISIGAWAVIDGPLLCNNNKSIGSKNKENWAILTTTYSKEPIIKMVNLGLIEWKNTVELDDIAIRGLEKVEFGIKIKNAIYYEDFGEFKKKIL